MSGYSPLGDHRKLLVILALVCGTNSPSSAQTTWHVDGPCGNDAWSGLSAICQAPDGPKRTIQAGMNLAQTGDTVLVADGTYTGAGNKWLGFPGGQNFLLRAENGPQNCCIDLEDSGLAFFLVMDETPEAVVDGFRIIHGDSSAGGAFYIHHSSQVTIANCILENNHSYFDGGAILCDDDSSPTLINCVIRRNHTLGNGGGISFLSLGHLTLINCALQGNHAQVDGGGVFLWGSRVDIINSTFVNNLAGGLGNGIASASEQASLVNSIVWGDAQEQIVDQTGDLTVMFSDVRGGWPGTGNIDVDPRFVRSGSIRLRQGSPCIDVGNNAAVPLFVTMDIFGSRRIMDGDLDRTPIVEMGAVEFGTLPMQVGG